VFRLLKQNHKMQQNEVALDLKKDIITSPTLALQARFCRPREMLFSERKKKIFLVPSHTRRFDILIIFMRGFLL
jgi:hypothetical protein